MFVYRADGQSGSPPVLGTGHSEGSNPFGATYLIVAQLGRASALGAEGRRFDSYR